MRFELSKNKSPPAGGYKLNYSHFIHLYTTCQEAFFLKLVLLESDLKCQTGTVRSNSKASARLLYGADNSSGLQKASCYPLLACPIVVEGCAHKYAAHVTVNHIKNEYVRGNAHTRQMYK